MNDRSPLDIIKSWLDGDGQAMAFNVAAALDQSPSNSADAADKLFWWLHRSDTPLQSRDMALRLRALVDFECFLANNEEHQAWIEDNIQTGVDHGQLPKEFRLGLNNAIAARPQTRQSVVAAAMTWPAVRPDDVSIYEWWRAKKPGVSTASND
jgi:hypothetical protein